MRISKFVQVDQNVLLEYVYDDGNLISEPYKILVNIKTSDYSYISGDSSTTINVQSNQLFQIDGVTNTYGKVDTATYSFLQINNFASGFPVQHDQIIIHLPTNYIFGQYIGCYLRIYTFDFNNINTYELSNFYFDITNTATKDLLDFDSTPFYFKEQLWGKSLTLDFPSIFAVANQRVNGSAKQNSVNYNLTKGVGLSQNSPVFIDFHFINTSQVINSVTTYLLAAAVTVTVPQTPEFEKLGLMIQESSNGDFFEIFGTYNGDIAEFNDFIVNSVQLGNRYFVQYTITLFEQNIRGQSLTVMVTNNFDSPVEYRPIIKSSTTTAIIDVQMAVIDAVDNSQIIRTGSFGMLQDQVSKYSLLLMKINLSNAAKPIIYNIKNPLGAGIFGSTASLSAANSSVVLQTVNVPFPVLIDRYNIIARSDNALFNSTFYYGFGNLMIVLYPFDNIIRFVIASAVATNTNKYLDLTNYGEIQLTIKNTQNSYSFDLFNDTNEVNLSAGIVVFRIPSSNINDIRSVYNSGINVFYITSTNQNLTSVIYSGLFTLYDALTNVTNLNSTVQQNKSSTLANPAIILDNSASNTTTGVAIVTRVAVPATASSNVGITQSGG